MPTTVVRGWFRPKTRNDRDLSPIGSSGQVHHALSEPLTAQAFFFAALVHDVDHPGISNKQLVKENAPVASEYDNKSIAEHNSVETAWSVFMRAEFKDLRSGICPTPEEATQCKKWDRD
jgi:3'5'-cyclic nucleotide phosphodiesterase